MASQIPLTTVEIGTTPPAVTLAQIPFLALDPGQLGTDDGFYFQQTERCVALPLLTASPSASPAAGSAFFWINNASGTYTLKIKIPAGTVLATGSLS